MGLEPRVREQKRQLEHRWLSLVRENNYAEADPIWIQLLDIRASSPLTVSTLTSELINRMEFFCYQLCDTTSLPLGSQDRILKEIQQIHSIKDMAALRTQVHRIYEAFSAAFRLSLTESQALDWSLKISAYIRNHYADPNLNGELLGRNFGLSPAYISHIFHRGTGVKLLDYIHMTRIAQVKLLLKDTRLRLPEIAQRTGYIDRYSMSRVFVRYVGITPTEYRTHSIA